jgi:hypothetical protein
MGHVARCDVPHRQATPAPGWQHSQAPTSALQDHCHQVVHPTLDVTPAGAAADNRDACTSHAPAMRAAVRQTCPAMQGGSTTQWGVQAGQHTPQGMTYGDAGPPRCKAMTESILCGAVFFSRVWTQVVGGQVSAQACRYKGGQQHLTLRLSRHTHQQPAAAPCPPTTGHPSHGGSTVRVRTQRQATPQAMRPATRPHPSPSCAQLGGGGGGGV